MYDVSVTHPSYILSDAFRFRKLALLSATYNLGVFPAMETLLLDLKAHALQDRTVALVENGSWRGLRRQANRCARSCPP